MRPHRRQPTRLPVPGILQARTLEWVAISFSSAWKWKVKVKSLSRVRLYWTHGLQPTRLLRPWDFLGKSTGVGCHCLLQQAPFSPLIYSTNHLHHDGIKHIYLILCAQVAKCKESTCQHRRCRFSPCVGKIPWSRKWQPNPVFLPGESHGQRRLEGYIPWGCKESDTTEHACLL